MVKRKTTQEIKEKIEMYTLNEFTMEGEYKNKSARIIIRHNKCGEAFKNTTSTFFNEFKCRVCGEIFDINLYFNIHSKQDFIDKLKEINNEFQLIGEFKDIYSPVSIRHKKCKHIQEIKAYKMLMNPICLRCNGGATVDQYTFLEKIFKIYNGEFMPLSNYTNSKASVEFIHSKCKRTFSQSASIAMTGELRCSHCSKESFWTTKKLQGEIDYLTHKNEYTVVEPYKGYDTPISIMHNICKGEFKLSPNVFMKTPKCPLCENNMSFGEKKTSDVLKEINIIYEREYSFKDCIHKQALSFDFALFDKNNNLVCLVEYDGMQHYFPIDKFGGIEGYKENKLKDGIKNTYCLNNNIPLIRIPYWEIDSIKKYLKNEFKKLNIKLI